MILRVFKFLFFLIFLTPFCLSAQTASIPDPVFEQFLINENIDSDNTVNGEVLLSDISGVTILFINEYDIANFEGLQYFTALTNFTININQANISTIDFSGNLLLTDLSIFNAPNLNEIVIDSNTLLERLQLWIDAILFDSINVSSNINLLSLSISGTAITTLDVSNNTNLSSLSVGGNPISDINIYGLTELQTLLAGNTQISSIDISTNVNLTELWVHNSNLNSANLKNGFNTLLTSVLLDGNPSLSCVEVDDSAFSNTATGWVKDNTASYSNNCNETLISTYPYIEDFESGPAGWTVQGSNPSWELGEPNGSVIQGAISGSNAWATNLTGSHNQNEGGWVESPIFDLSPLTTPYLQLNAWWNCISTSGVVVQSTVDNGFSWQNVGAFSDEPNWYNSNSISSQPGGSNEGWSGYGAFAGGSIGWVSANHYLNGLEGENSVKFRVFFSSPNAQAFIDGFAFDNFSILEAPCYAGEDEDVNVIGCFLPGGIENLNEYLTTGANENGTWTALDALAISGSGDVDYSSVDFTGDYGFQYTVTTEGGACVDTAVININVRETLSAGTTTTIETCGGDEFYRSDMLDFIELYFGGPDTTGIWTDGNGDDVSFPIYPSDSDVYTYTHEAISGCPEQSSTVTFEQPPILEAGESVLDTEDLGCNPPTLNLTNKLINADFGGQWRTLPIGDFIEIDTTPDGNGGTVDEVDFGTLGAGSYFFRFEYSVPDDCGLSNNATATFEFEIFISTSGVSSITLAICENEFISEDFLNNFVNEDGTGLGSWDYTGPGSFGDVGVYEFSNGCGEPSGAINVYLNALRPKVFLQGAMMNPNPGEENLMRDDLRVLGHLPGNSPYGDNAGIIGNPFSVTGSNAIVDWVLVELRNENDNTSVVSSQSALLQRDGDVVGLDGTSALCFKDNEFNQAAFSGSYYVAIKHRNHLGVMTANTKPIGLSETETVVDFTDVNTPITYGTHAQAIFGMPTGILGLWSGNTNSGNEIRFSGANNDSNTIKDFVLADPANGFNSVTFSSAGYSNADLNLDGVIKFSGSGNDSNIIKDNVLAHPGNGFNSPTFTIVPTID